MKNCISNIYAHLIHEMICEEKYTALLNAKSCQREKNKK